MGILVGIASLLIQNETIIKHMRFLPPICRHQQQWGYQSKLKPTEIPQKESAEHQNNTSESIKKLITNDTHNPIPR